MTTTMTVVGTAKETAESTNSADPLGGATALAGIRLPTSGVIPASRHHVWRIHDVKECKMGRQDPWNSPAVAKMIGEHRWDECEASGLALTRQAARAAMLWGVELATS